MTRTIVGVLRGGTSSQYDLSLKTGAEMIAALPLERYAVRDILIDRSGMWHIRGIPATPVRALSQVDVVLNALHGGVGEDGTVGRLLDQLGVSYAGSRPLASGLALNKVRARQILARAGVRMPRGMAFRHSSGLNTNDMARAVFDRFGPPYVVKPPLEGASHGIRIARNYIELPDVLGDLIDRFGAALVEEFVRGHEARVGVIEQFRNEDLYALPPARVSLPPDATVVERRHYAEDALTHVVPSNFSDEQKRDLIQTARAAHRALGLSHFSQADLMVTPRHVYLLGINTNPGFYPGAPVPHMLESVGASKTDFLSHAIGLARQ